MTSFKERAETAKSWLFQEKHRETARTLASKVMRAFTEHPAATGESYFEHLKFTVAMSSRILLCGFCLLLHGLLPFLFTRTTSLQIEGIYVILKNRIPKDRREQLEIIYEI